MMPTASSTMSSTTGASAPSSSPSSSSFHFPSVLPRKEQPNAHPYAIQTSSTAILSRSNSTSAHASVGPHHYIPMSPSPTSPQHSPTKRHRPTRHRYSRSLTSDQPPPLPRPPGVASNQTRDGEDDFPRKHGHRADTLPSFVGLSLDLPDDPKSWTPSQLSMYLSATLRTGDANLPAPVAKDIAKFVNERRITGKAFLRLSQDDLLQFGINELWRATLLAASRGLRQTILRGRIWGFGYTPPNEEDEDPGNLSSSSSASSNGTKAPRVRSRHSSLASDHGKVKDLVYSLEQSSPTRVGSDGLGYDVSDDSDNEGISAKSAKRMSSSTESFSSNHHKDLPPTPSPSKSHRSLPPRGLVNDLFNPPTVDSDTAVQAKEDDTTIKNVAKRNVNGREPRMLPFPPSQAPIITPLHTGSYFPLPLSPEHTGSGYNALHAADYEMGFRSRPRSPHSQVFVVRHNPASPSNSLRVDESKGKRLLPFPPVTGETHLHHPKPRRLVGNIDDSSELDANAHETNGTTDSTTSGTEGYETALETQSEGDSEISNSTVNDGHEEPTMQELVASEPTSKPISGVEAWELDLGETVKRIGRDVDESGFERAGSVSEIGRKAGGRDVPYESKRGHIKALFEPPEEEMKPSVGTDKSSETADLQERRLEEMENELRLREQHLSEKERTIAGRELAIAGKEQGITQREQVIQRLQLDVERREAVVNVQEQSLAKEQLLEAEQQMEIREQAIMLEDRDRLLRAREKALKDKESNMATREERIQRREVEVRMWEERIEAKEEELNERLDAAALAASESPLDMILRRCWRMLGMDTTATGDSISSVPRQTDARNIRRDILFGPSRSGGYIFLMSIGVCVVALRVLGKIRRR